MSKMPTSNNCRTLSLGVLHIPKRKRSWISRHQDEQIVTPFAQILACLKNVRHNLTLLSGTTTENLKPNTNSNINRTHNYHSNSISEVADDTTSLAARTMDELDWCLNQLENMQSCKTISDLASSKFKKMLNKELNNFTEHNKSDAQISAYIKDTFIDKEQEVDVEFGLSKSDNGDALSINNEEDENEKEADKNDHNNNTNINENESKSAKAKDSSEKSKSNVIDTSKSLSKSNHNDTSAHQQAASANTSDKEAQSSTTPNTNALTTQQPSPNTANTIRVTNMMSNIFSLNTMKPINAATPNTNAVDHVYGVEATDFNELDKIMKNIDVWGIDLFRVDDLTMHRPLTAITYTIFKKRDIIKKFQIPTRKLFNYLNLLEDHYQNVPYHNRIHAADVTQSVHVLLNSKVLEGVFSDLEIFATVFAAAIHDVDHPGLTNPYLITTGSELAIMYNDESVLENHHLAVAFKLLQHESRDIIHGLSKKQRQTFRKTVIDMVLATDMSKHMSLLAELKTMVESKKVSCSDYFALDNYPDRIRVLQNMIHCADLSNPTKPLYLYKEWTNRVMSEFFLQGDREFSEGLEISAMCDRHSASVEKSQVGFIDFIVHPLWESWSDLVAPEAQYILETLEGNRDWYFSQIDKTNQQAMMLSHSKSNEDAIEEEH